MYMYTYMFLYTYTYLRIYIIIYTRHWCLQQVYGDHMKGTKFERIGAVSKSSSSDNALAQERRAVASKVNIHACIYTHVYICISFL